MGSRMLPTADQPAFRDGDPSNAPGALAPPHRRGGRSSQQGDPTTQRRSARPRPPSVLVHEGGQILGWRSRSTWANCPDAFRKLSFARRRLLIEVNRFGPVLAVRLNGRCGRAPRFLSPDAFANYAGVAPIVVSSGEQAVRRLSRSGDRRLNSTLHLVAVTKVGCVTAPDAATTTPKPARQDPQSSNPMPQRQDGVPCLAAHARRRTTTILLADRRLPLIREEPVIPHSNRGSLPTGVVLSGMNPSGSNTPTTTGRFRSWYCQASPETREPIETIALLAFLIFAPFVVFSLFDRIGDFVWFVPPAVAALFTLCSWRRLPQWCTKVMNKSATLIVSVAAAGTSVALVGLALYGTVVSLEVLRAVSEQDRVLEEIAIPQLVWIVTIASGAWALFGSVLFIVTPKHCRVLRSTSASIAVASAILLPLLLALSGHYIFNTLDLSLVPASTGGSPPD